jgi:hypothetical protein
MLESGKIAGFKRMKQFKKTCIVCGREIQWRKKWQDNWQQVKYFSRACRKAGLTKVDIKLERAIMRLLQSRKPGASICPSEAARAVARDNDAQPWRPLMEPARRAARRLVHQGKISIMQGGKIVDPSRFKGPVRLKRRQCHQQNRRAELDRR